MSEHDPHDQTAGPGPGPGYGYGPGEGPGPAGPGAPGYGYGWPGPWGWYPPQGMGPMGPPGGYGPGPMGPPPGYMGGPGFEQPGPGAMGGPGHGQAGPPPGAGRGQGPSMDQIVEELSNGGGLGGIGKLLDFEDTEFWKGALVGAAAVLLLTNESVQQSLFKSGVKARDAVEKGFDSLRGGGKAGQPDDSEKKTASAGTAKAKTSANDTKDAT